MLQWQRVGPSEPRCSHYNMRGRPTAPGRSRGSVRETERSTRAAFASSDREPIPPPQGDWPDTAVGQAMQEAYRRAGRQAPFMMPEPSATPSSPTESDEGMEPAGEPWERNEAAGEGSDTDDRSEPTRRTGGDGPPAKGPPPDRDTRPLPRWAIIGIACVGALIVITIAAFAFSSIWTEHLWFSEVGYTSLFWSRLWGKLAVGATAGVFALSLFLINGFLAKRLIRRPPPRGTAVTNESGPAGGVANRTLTIGLLASGAAVGLFFGLAEGVGWEEILLFFNRTEVGYTDPLFGRDASFFIYALPFLRRILDFFTAALICTLLGVIGVYVLQQAVTVKGRRVTFAPYVKGHISVLTAFLLVSLAAGFMITSWELVHSSRGVVFGAGFTDTAAQLPVMRVLALFSLVSAVIFLVNIYYQGWRLPLVAVGFLTLMWLGAGQIYPAVIQQYRVSPNEIAMESPYIAMNIDATRFAYGLDDVKTTPFPARADLSAESISNNRATVNNIRLWDARALLEAYTQQQELRLYYRFRDVDVDRYEVSLNYRQVMLSARELDQEQLLSQAKTWVNEHLTYTHGYGVVVSSVNSTSAEGLPEYFVKNIPPQTLTSLEVTRPEIYYGEIGNDFVIVKTKAKEFDYPRQDDNAFTTYAGTGGVLMDSFWKRLAFVLRFGDLKLLASEYLTPESRIMFRRTIKERVSVIAPFLKLDGDPYVVIRDDGTLVWMWDAYTTTSRFPYSEPRSSGLNYIRNSVKVVIDAYHGSVTLYQIDPDDALATTYAKTYPGLFRPADELPDDLRSHLRYPKDLFAMQAQVLSVYHMLDPQMFYNKEDVWQIPHEIYSAEEVPVSPYYAIMSLPGGEVEEFLLLQPFAPLEKTNMAAWMAARMDGEHYGEIVVFEFPRDKLVFGPVQVEARISNDPAISAQLALWNQAGGRVIRGNLLVIPIDDSLLYVEPLYLQAEQRPIPELKRVIVCHGDRVIMEPTLAKALERLFGTEAEPPISGPAGDTGTTTTTTSTTVPDTSSTTTTGTDTSETGPDGTDTSGTDSTTTTTGKPLPTDKEELIALAVDLYTRALEAQRAGDWSEYGQLIQELGRVLATLQALSGL